MFDFLLEFVGVVFNKDILFHFFFTLKRVSPLGTFWNEGPDPQVLWYADPWAPLAASDGGSLHFVRRRLVATALTINQSFISQITAQMYSWMDELKKNGYHLPRCLGLARRWCPHPWWEKWTMYPFLDEDRRFELYASRCLKWSSTKHATQFQDSVQFSWLTKKLNIYHRFMIELLVESLNWVSK